MTDPKNISVIIPTYNEAAALEHMLPNVQAAVPDAQIIVVDDGSEQPPHALCERLGITLIAHPINLGNGAAIKTGARHASGDILVFMDGDGQHNPADIQRLLEQLEAGYDMVVGARQRGSQANMGRGMANKIYNTLASLVVGHKVPDLTSGMRAARAALFKQFLYLLPNRFSYPTTSTMAFFRSGYPVGYIPITAAKRTGKSHIKPLRDGVRFLLIIFKLATLYSPLKIFAPTAALFFLLGCGNYSYTFLTQGRLTNMSVLMWSVAVIIFLIGLISEQITALMYHHDD